MVYSNYVRQRILFYCHFSKSLQQIVQNLAEEGHVATKAGLARLVMMQERGEFVLTPVSDQKSKMTSEAKWIIEEHPGCLRPSSRHSYDHPPSKVAMCSHAKCKSDIYFYSVYCIHTLNENIDLAFGLPNVLFLLFFFILPDPHHVLVITLGVTLPKSQSQMTILLFSDKTSYSQNGCR